MSDSAPRSREDLEREIAELKARLAGETSGREDVASSVLDRLAAGVVQVGPDGAILRANALALEILGMSYDAISQRYTADFVAIREDGTPCPVEEYPVSRALSTGEPHGPMVLGVRRPDRNLRWAVFTAAPVRDQDNAVSGAVVTFVDVTPRRKAEERFRETESLLWSYLEGTPAMIMFLDRDLRIQFMNRYIDGHDARSTRDRPIRDFLAPADRERITAILENVLATGKPAQYEVAPNEGVYRAWYSCDVGPVRRDGEIVGLVITVNDVSDRVELQSRLLVADRLASLGTMAAGVAHEINNPLTYVLANLQRLTTADESRFAELVASATEGAERIRDVVRDLSALSRAPSERSAPVDLHSVLEASIRMAQSELQHRAVLVRSFGDPPVVRAEASRLGQVFLNILINAAQSIPVGSVSQNRVEVSTSKSPTGWAVIDITDTGCGMSEEIATRIFEPFVTTKVVGSGTGLGLYISSSIVKTLGGRLSVVSAEGKGSRFRIELPPDSAIGTELSHRSSEIRVPERVRILIIDDEPGVLGFMHDVLIDHEVETADSGRAALERLQSEHFDLVFCDLIMPDVTGMDVYQSIRGDLPELADRFVFMTGGAFTEDSRAFIASVERPILEKPFSIAEMLEYVAEAGRRCG